MGIHFSPSSEMLGLNLLNLIWRQDIELQETVEDTVIQETTWYCRQIRNLSNKKEEIQERYISTDVNGGRRVQ
jgi:hypothetical protein